MDDLRPRCPVVGIHPGHFVVRRRDPAYHGGRAATPPGAGGGVDLDAAWCVYWPPGHGGAIGWRPTGAQSPTFDVDRRHAGGELGHGHHLERCVRHPDSIGGGPGFWPHERRLCYSLHSFGAVTGGNRSPFAPAPTGMASTGAGGDRLGA